MYYSAIKLGFCHGDITYMSTKVSSDCQYSTDRLNRECKTSLICGVFAQEFEPASFIYQWETARNYLLFTHIQEKSDTTLQAWEARCHSSHSKKSSIKILQYHITHEGLHLTLRMKENTVTHLSDHRIKNSKKQSSWHMLQNATGHAYMRIFHRKADSHLK